MSLVIPAESGPRLGPTVYTPVVVNGVSTDALIDTGSPVTIVFLEFILKVLSQNRPQDQTDTQWIESTQENFKDPDVTLKSCGGHRLDFTAQIELSLYRGDRHLTSTVLVRKGTPNDLLVGTDVQPKFGISVVTRDDDGGVTGLFSGKHVDPGRNVQPSLDTNLEPEQSVMPASGTGPSMTVPHPASVDKEGSKAPSTDGHEVRLLQTGRFLPDNRSWYRPPLETS